MAMQTKGDPFSTTCLASLALLCIMASFPSFSSKILSSDSDRDLAGTWTYSDNIKDVAFASLGVLAPVLYYPLICIYLGPLRVGVSVS